MFLKLQPHPILEGHTIARDQDFPGYSVVVGPLTQFRYEVKTPTGAIERFMTLQDAQDFIVEDADPNS